jgi:hypothetical protein
MHFGNDPETDKKNRNRRAGFFIRVVRNRSENRRVFRSDGANILSPKRNSRPGKTSTEQEIKRGREKDPSDLVLIESCFTIQHRALSDQETFSLLDRFAIA